MSRPAQRATAVSASTLVEALRHLDTSEVLVRSRLSLAATVACELAGHEPVVAALVVGSTALRRCTADADLDLVVITSTLPRENRFDTVWVDGVRVEIERLGRTEALACTRGDGWVWELRQAARLGCGVPVLDPRRFGARLRRRAAAMVPDADRYEAVLRSVYVLLVELAGQPADDPRWFDHLRGCLDNLGLLNLLERPRRYQKPKWALADLLHAGEAGLVEAIIASYAIVADDALSAAEAVTGTHRLIGTVYDRVGIPSHEQILAMGYAPQWAEASYVSRTLADADELRATGRFIEATYVARFAARLAAGLVDGGVDTPGVVDALAQIGGGELAEGYLALFPEPRVSPADLLDAALAAADACRRSFEARMSPSLAGMPA